MNEEFKVTFKVWKIEKSKFEYGELKEKFFIK